MSYFYIPDIKFYTLTKAVQHVLLQMPESGMGYQVIRVLTTSLMRHSTYVVLNAELAFEACKPEQLPELVSRLQGPGFERIKQDSDVLNVRSLEDIRLLQRTELNWKGQWEPAAPPWVLQQPLRAPSAEEVFVRLSAYPNDRRISKVKKALRPGSFAIPFDDYLHGRFNDLDLIGRYALPGVSCLRTVFHFRAQPGDLLQRVVVDPANGLPGGGEEVFFPKGTSPGSYYLRSAY